MKRHRSLVAIIASLTIIFSMQSICFAWTTGSSNNTYYTTDGNKVETSINSSGQTVYRVYQITSGQKYLILEVFTRGSNIWNNTSSVLFANGTNKSASYCGIDRQLNVYGIEDVDKNLNVNGNNNLDIATRFQYGFTQWDKPERLTEYPGAYDFERDEDGFVTGIYTSYGLYDIQSDRIINSSNNSNGNSNNTYSKYPYIIQNDDEYDCYVAQNKCYTYKLSSSAVLSCNGRSVASSVNPDLQCGINNYLVFTRLDKAYIVKMGAYDAKMLCEDFAEFIYQSGRVVGAKDIYGRSYWIDNYNSSYDYDNDYDNDYDYEYDYEYYPNAIQDGNYYCFSKNSFTEYKYELNDYSTLYYWDYSNTRTFIANNVDYIAFSDEYMFYVTGSSAKAVKFGSTTTSKTYSRFIDFEYNEEGFVIGVITSNGTTWL